MSKSTSAKNISAFADLVKVSRKNTSFDFCSTNIIELTHKIFYLHAIIISAPFIKFVREGFVDPSPPTHSQMPNWAGFSLRGRLNRASIIVIWQSQKMRFYLSPKSFFQLFLKKCSKYFHGNLPRNEFFTGQFNKGF